MRSSDILIEHIKRSEACSLRAYRCPAGVLTIGYGHTKGVKEGDRITQRQADEFLKQDLAEFEAVANKCKHLSSQGRYDAVVDFIYNCGVGNWNSSTLKKYIEENRPTWEIQEQFLRWTFSKGVKMGGLVTRRIWEANRFNE